MIQKIRIRALQDVLDIVCVLIRNNYTCETKSVYKKFPEERSIDYFEIAYWRNDENDEQDDTK